MHRAPRLVLTAFITLGLAGCGEGLTGPAACAGRCDDEGRRQATIVNGQHDPGHPSVGTLDDQCTATLVGSRTVLTAAHCISSATTTFKVGGASYAGTTIKHPQYNDGALENDIALVRLHQAPTVPSSPILDTAPSVGQQVLIVGFGVTSEQAQDFGTKRVAHNTISAVTGQQITFLGASGAVGNHCYGDSGGPAFVSVGGLEAVAGVTSYGNGPCGIDGVDTRVDAYESWIVSASGGDARLASQGAAPPAPAPPEPASPAPAPAPPPSAPTVEPAPSAEQPPSAEPSPVDPGAPAPTAPQASAGVAYGAACLVAADCASGICAANPEEGTGGFCSARCGGDLGGCAGDAVCYPSADPTLSVCGPLVGATAGGATVEGSLTALGCAVGGAGDEPPLVGLLIGLLMIALRRLRRR